MKKGSMLVLLTVALAVTGLSACNGALSTGNAAATTAPATTSAATTTPAASTIPATTTPAATTVAPNPTNLQDAAPDFDSWPDAQIAQLAQVVCAQFAANNGSLSAVENDEANANAVAGSDLTASDLAYLIVYSAATYCTTYVPTVMKAMVP